MSRIYFTSPSGDAEVRGSERAWMGCFLSDLYTGLIDPMFHRYDDDRLVKLLPQSHYLKTKPGSSDWARWAEWQARYRTSIAISDHLIEWHGVDLSMFSFVLNTACVVGNAAVRLMARLHGQCEIYTWVDGPDRAWLADVIEEGMPMLFRPDAGWEQVIELLRKRDDEPVVTWYSVTDGFPDRECSEWVAPEGDDDGDGWYDLSAEQQWASSMAWLRNQEGHLQMTLESQKTMQFTHELSIFDLMASDYEDRLDAAVDRVTV